MFGNVNIVGLEYLVLCAHILPKHWMGDLPWIAEQPKKKLEIFRLAASINLMKSMKHVLLSFVALAFAAAAFAAPSKEDPIIIQHSKLDAKRLQPGAVPSSSGQWTRIEIPLFAKENPDNKANNQKWIRNVDVDLILMYKDQMATDKRSLDSLIVLRSKAKLFALEINKKTPVVFYIPSEAYEIYRLAADPFAWKIEVSINGTPIELTKQNIKTMLSRNIYKNDDPKAVYESFMKLVEKSAKVNDGVLMSLPECPFNVKLYEYGKSQLVPNYITTK